MRDWLLIGGFVLTLLIPTTVMLLDWEPALGIDEQRTTAPFPETELLHTPTAWTSGFNAWFDDHFGLRKALIYTRSLTRAYVFGANQTERVVFGDDQWQFYKPTLTRNRDWDAAFYDQWAAALKRRHDWLAEQGIPYLFVIVPAKPTIYLEETPAAYRDMYQIQPMLDFAPQMAARGQTVLDLTDAVLAGKDRGRLFYKTDTHWNFMGAYFGYRGLLEHLQAWGSDLKPLPFEAFAWQEEWRTGGELSQILGLKQHLGEHSYIWPKGYTWTAGDKTELPLYKKEPLAPARTPFVRHNPNQTKRVMLIRDSFATAMMPYITEHFGETLSFWDRPDFDMLKRLVEREKPDWVIEQRSARMLRFIMDDE